MATTIREALSRWEERTKEKPAEAEAVHLFGQVPPIKKMDSHLASLANVRTLSLSSNCIDKIGHLNGLKNLTVLSLGRNNIRAISGLEAVADTLEELWISYNFIEKLKGIEFMKKLRVLYMANNVVKDWAEFARLASVPCLAELVFVGNPLEEKHTNEGNWTDEASKRIPHLRKLDGEPVVKDVGGGDEEGGEEEG